MRPLLLRSAGVVGLTGAILGVISSGALFAGPDSRQPEQVSAAEEQDPARVEPAPKNAFAGAVNFTPAAGVFTRDNSDQTPPVTVASITPAPPTASSAPAPSQMAEADPAEQMPPVTNAPAPVAIAEPAVPVEPPSQSAGGASVEVATAPAPGGEETRNAESASLWSDDAMDCPRDWVAESGSAAGADCREPSAEPTAVAAASPNQSALDEAAVERASEEAGLQFVARVPMARPDYKPPAPPRRKNVTRAGASRPADAPPKCGSKKRAKWRYVNKVPTWYCR